MFKKKDFISLIFIILLISSFSYTSVAFANGQAGTTLSATVNITPHWTITYGWSIDKSVSPDSWELMTGQSGESTYTITLTKDSGTEEAWVSGEVCVTNGGAVATENLSIVANLYNGYPPPNDFIASANVDISSNPVLDPGETGCYDYIVNIPIIDGTYPQPHAGGTYKITANVTITNHSGSLGTPKGPAPSDTTTFLSNPTLINNTINVDDTNGGSWTFSSSGSVTYNKTFTCNQDEGEHNNTATIRETGQSDSATVTVVCKSIPPSGTVTILKFYDKNANGTHDPGEPLLNDWLVSIGDSPYCTPHEETLELGTYTISEGLLNKWIPTTLASFEIEVGNEPITIEFGNVCIGAGGGKTLGYWSNKNGQATMNDDGSMTSELSMLTELCLRKSNGDNFDPTSYSGFRSWLLSANSTNMAYMLSAQLAAMELNVEAGFVKDSAIVYAPGVDPNSDFITINNLRTKANNALCADGYTPSGDPNRMYQEYLKNALDYANNNLNFVQNEPCDYSFPQCPPQTQP